MRHQFGTGPAQAGPVSWRPLPGADAPQPRRVGESLPAVTRNLAGPDGVHLVNLVVDAGPRSSAASVASHSRPLGCVAHTLTIAVDQPGWATELTFLETQLRARIDKALGPGVVTRSKSWFALVDTPVWYPCDVWLIGRDLRFSSLTPGVCNLTQGVFRPGPPALDHSPRRQWPDLYACERARQWR